MGWFTATWPLSVAVVGFLASALAIGVAGSRLARITDRLADRTGLGEAITGTVVLAGATSLAGLVVSVTAAVADDASLAVTNSTGGIAAQTAFIVAADVAYRRVNLEHAAASVTNVFTSFLMVTLLALVLAGAAAPAWSIGGVHPVTPVLVAVYAYGLRLARQVSDQPMWLPQPTSETRLDEPSSEGRRASLSALWGQFAATAAVVTTAGWVVARSGESLVETTGLSATFVGAFLTSVTTSLPELVTAVAAVRSGALTLAVGGIVGGNTFDVLFIAAADVAYRPGPVYAGLTDADTFVVAWTILLVAIVGAGLVHRDRIGIGFEGVAVAFAYLAGLAVVATR